MKRGIGQIENDCERKWLRQHIRKIEQSWDAHLVVGGQPPAEGLDVVVRTLDQRLTGLVIGHGLLGRATVS